MYKPSTNEQAERIVQSFKSAMKSASHGNGSIHQKFASFLLAYRNTPHSATKETPAKMFIERRLRLDLMKPNAQETVKVISLK